jgi:hypothetical protein
MNAATRVLATAAKLAARRFLLLAPALVALAAGSSQAREFAACALAMFAVVLLVESTIRVRSRC